MNKDQERKFTDHAYGKNYGETYDDANRRKFIEEINHGQTSQSSSSRYEGLGLPNEMYIDEENMTFFGKALVYIGYGMVMLAFVFYLFRNEASSGEHIFLGLWGMALIFLVHYIDLIRILLFGLSAFIIYMTINAGNHYEWSRLMTHLSFRQATLLVVSIFFGVVLRRLVEKRQ